MSFTNKLSLRLEAVMCTLSYWTARLRYVWRFDRDALAVLAELFRIQIVPPPSLRRRSAVAKAWLCMKEPNSRVS